MSFSLPACIGNRRSGSSDGLVERLCSHPHREVRIFYRLSLIYILLICFLSVALFMSDIKGIVHTRMDVMLLSPPYTESESELGLLSCKTT